MGSRPHGNTMPVNHRCHVMGMGAIHGEGNDGALVFGRAKKRRDY